MSTNDLADALWFKSSYSNGTGECVEVVIIGDQVATRDSKDPSGPNLAFTAEAWTAFVRGVTLGEFPGT
ncbi:DUF397 domain-containing protein [Streptomyces sp. NPDC021020]|uniref:DUF397 domain-containing protein n=1 Tax=Streptomyces sp. NPDC021020 TaxID=3365109 RepID=UPI0037B47D3E